MTAQLYSKHVRDFKKELNERISADPVLQNGPEWYEWSREQKIENAQAKFDRVMKLLKQEGRQLTREEGDQLIFHCQGQFIQ